MPFQKKIKPAEEGADVAMSDPIIAADAGKETQQQIADLQATVARLTRLVEAKQDGPQVIKDQQDVPRKAVEEFLVAPCNPMQYFLLGPDHARFQLDPGREEFNPHTRIPTRVDGCVAVFNRWKNVGADLMGKAVGGPVLSKDRFIAVAYLDQMANISITDEDVERFGLPATTQRKHGPHPLAVMIERLHLKPEYQQGKMMNAQRMKFVVEPLYRALYQQSDFAVSEARRIEEYDRANLKMGRLVPAGVAG